MFLMLDGNLRETPRGKRMASRIVAPLWSSCEHETSTNAMLQMSKIDISELQRAYEGQ